MGKIVTEIDKELKGDLILKGESVCSEKFSVISADIPWKYDDKKMNRGGAARYYDTLTLEQVRSINVQSVAADDCVLMLWATAPLLPEALSVIEAWGFTYRTVGFVWVKRSAKYWDHFSKRVRNEFAKYHALFGDVEGSGHFSLTSLKTWFGADWLMNAAKSKTGNAYNTGMGSYTRSNAEFVLLAVKGNGAALIKDHSINQIIDACLMEHSRKPDEYLELVEHLTGDVPRFEMFARRRRDGWKVLGNQLESDYLLSENMELVPLAEPINLNHKPTSKPYVRKAPALEE